LSAAVAPQPEIAAGMSPPLARRLIYCLGAETFSDRVKRAWASAPAGDPRPWLGLLDEARSWPAPRFPLTGDDAAAAGLPAGPAIGKALRKIEAWWVEQDFQPDVQVLRDRLKSAV
jgi:poly(A) polymerase